MVKVVFEAHDRVWVVDASDIPGLYLADDTLDGLVAKINLVAPRLLEDQAVRPEPPRLHIDIHDIQEAPAAYARPDADA